MVRATNATGTGLASAPSNAVTTLHLPSEPRNVSAVIGELANAANVSFLTPLDFGAGISGYRVTSNPAGGVDASDGQFGETHTVTGLAAGTSYTFTVQALSADGAGPSSAPSNAVTPFAVPGAPTSVVAAGGDTQATVTFVAPVNNGGQPITGYAVVSGNPNTSDLDWGSTSLTHRIQVINGMSYSFQVKASNMGGTGPLSVASNTIGGRRTAPCASQARRDRRGPTSPPSLSARRPARHPGLRVYGLPPSSPAGGVDTQGRSDCAPAVRPRRPGSPTARPTPSGWWRPTSSEAAPPRLLPTR